ncbi:MAG: NADH-quinone oxidoreductase subunit C [Candidatus Omnitrophica bacterium]|nr:NADH-quinone oxidoreductase subunit C [Candidatus Omnitrophota bacterium]
MPHRKLHAKNNQGLDLDRVPLLERDVFRKTVLESCSANARVVNLFAGLRDDGDALVFCVLGDDEQSRLHIFSTRVLKDDPSFPSLTPELPQCHLFEREMAEQFAIRPEGHPWLKPVRVISGGRPFFEIRGGEAHEVAVGPVHAGVIEPGHFRFQCAGEEILNLEIQLGYQHRGVEPLMEEAPAPRAAWVAESIAGDTVIGHATAYCGVIESLSGCPISPRANCLRAVALELERVANHTGDLGALSGDIGFLPAAAYFGRLRGEFLNLLMELCGNRYGRSFCRPGGVLFDIDARMAGDFTRRLLKAGKEIDEVADLFFTRSSVLSRLEGVGVVSHQTAKDLGLVGPAARASGCGRDVRTDYAYGMYRFCHIPISLAGTGDVHARAVVRWLESQRSIDYLIELLNKIPKGALLAPPGPLRPNQIAFSMVEGWRGEITHSAITGPGSRIVRYKVKDPSFNNWAALEQAVRGAQISDFPLCNKSFNLSYAGHDL